MEPFLDIWKVEYIIKECVATRTKTLSTKAPKKFVEKLDHNSKVSFKNSHPNASNSTFKDNRVRNINVTRVSK